MPRRRGVERVRADVRNPLDQFNLDPLTAWRNEGDRIIAQHIAQHPGTRPKHWWRFDAPREEVVCHRKRVELVAHRQRLGGIGTPSHEVLVYEPEMLFGLPRFWITRQMAAYFGQKFRDFSGVAIDPDDPPIFESQAAYLDRHGLLGDDERARLSPIDFQPEGIKRCENLSAIR